MAPSHVKDYYLDDGAWVWHGFISGDSWMSGQVANLNSCSRRGRH